MPMFNVKVAKIDAFGKAIIKGGEAHDLWN